MGLSHPPGPLRVVVSLALATFVSVVINLVDLGLDPRPPITAGVEEGFDADWHVNETHCVDPNSAPWMELAMLPKIGRVRARAIVAYREERLAAGGEGVDEVVFTCAEDLAEVHGIGPKTVARLRPYLVFRDGSKAGLRGSGLRKSGSGSTDGTNEPVH